MKNLTKTLTTATAVGLLLVAGTGCIPTVVREVPAVPAAATSSDGHVLINDLSAQVVWDNLSPADQVAMCRTLDMPYDMFIETVTSGMSGPKAENDALADALHNRFVEEC